MRGTGSYALYLYILTPCSRTTDSHLWYSSGVHSHTQIHLTLVLGSLPTINLCSHTYWSSLTILNWCSYPLFSTLAPTVLHSRTHLIFALALQLWPQTHFFIAPNGLFKDQQGLLLTVQQVAIEHLEAGMDWPNTSMPYIPDSKSRIPCIPLLLPNGKLQKYLGLHPLHSISPHHSWHPLTGLLLSHPLTDLLLLHPPALMGLVLSCPLMSILLLPLSFSLMCLHMLPLTPILILILSVDFLLT